MGRNSTFLLYHSSAIMLALAVLFCIFATTFASRSPYIVNGRDANVGEFPWQGSLQVWRQHTCGASLVSSTWLVTAAHCIGNYGVNNYKVVMGAHDKDGLKQGSPVAYEIEQFYVHPKWTGDLSVPSDIAMIKLKAPVEMNTYVKTIRLPSSSDNFEGMGCMISGWGSLYGANTELPNILKKLPVTVQRASQCMAGGARQGFHICVRKAGSSACTGDSGGPLACKRGSTWYLVGAASYVYGDCSTQYPTVYSGVAYHRNWIKETSGL